MQFALSLLVGLLLLAAAVGGPEHEQIDATVLETFQTDGTYYASVATGAQTEDIFELAETSDQYGVPLVDQLIPEQRYQLDVVRSPNRQGRIYAATPIRTSTNVDGLILGLDADTADTLRMDGIREQFAVTPGVTLVVDQVYHMFVTGANPRRIVEARNANSATEQPGRGAVFKSQQPPGLTDTPRSSFQFWGQPSHSAAIHN